MQALSHLQLSMEACHLFCIQMRHGLDDMTAAGAEIKVHAGSQMKQQTLHTMQQRANTHTLSA